MRIVFMGTPEFAVPSLERLIADRHEIAAVYTQPDKPKNRGMKLLAPPVKKVALAHAQRPSTGRSSTVRRRPASPLWTLPRRWMPAI